MKLNNFAGGQSSRVRPQFLALNEGVVYDNIDMSVGSLQAVKDKLASAITTPKFSILFEGNWVGSAAYSSSVVYGKKLYRADGVHPTEFDNGASVPLGVVFPTVAPTTTTTVEANAVEGTVQYVYSYYSSATGVESAVSPISVSRLSQGRMTLTDMQVSADPRTNQKRIYRVGGDLTVFTLVDTIPNSDVAYEDIIPAVDVDGRLRPELADLPAPETLNHIAESYAMLFGAEGAKLRYTPIGRPQSWPETHFLQFSEDITGIGAVANGLLVMTGKRTHLVSGSSPESLSPQLLDGSQGCKGSQSIRQLGSGLLWVSDDGICTSNGGKVSVLSRNKLGKINIDVVNSAVHDDVYYLATATNIVAFDMRFGGAFKTFSLDVETVTVGDDVLYGWKDGILHELFAADSNISMNYLSPIFPEGMLTEDKTYKKVYISHKGDIILNILIDGFVVNTGTFTGDGVGDVQIPNFAQRGYTIQFNITGTGEVSEIEYKTSSGKGHD
ncbi:MAG: hypothetical protein HRU18_06735 [Pseudoalteromonas sp.]|uniref:hypothetical protein n=1 Tax=Pseudoalteromonas sp. TaxID=53249 RepID=UPI001DD3DE0E|nr:hypothetical protein [Pseudoalteromonas sp.]NRA77886.1 hypothetical protein [Pseudoalteromonas sp.]